MGKVPEFELVSVGLGPVTDAVPTSSQSEKPHTTDEQLWRKYRLFVEEFDCEILEVFPTREMFVGGLHWLEETHGALALDQASVVRFKQVGLVLLFGCSLLFMLAYVSASLTGQFSSCPI